MADIKDLINPEGQPLIKEPQLVVLKHPRHVRINPELVGQIADILRCAVIILPMDSEFLMGNLAQQEMENIHSGIHAIEDALRRDNAKDN